MRIAKPSLVVFIVCIVGAVNLSFGFTTIRGGFAAGGAAVNTSYTARGMFTEISRVVNGPASTSADNGPLSFIDFTHAGPQPIVLSDPNGGSSIGGLTQGELFFYSALTATGSAYLSEIYGRLPRIVEGPGGLLLHYTRSGAAKHAMGWSYEVSSDLQDWVAFTPEMESVDFDASRNLSDITVRLPFSSPVFVRIRLNYNVND